MKKLLLLCLIFLCLGCNKLKGKDGHNGTHGLPGAGTMLYKEGLIPASHTIRIPELANKVFFINVYVYINNNYREIPNPITTYYSAYYTLSFTTGELHFANCPASALYKINILLKEEK